MKQLLPRRSIVILSTLLAVAGVLVGTSGARGAVAGAATPGSCYYSYYFHQERCIGSNGQTYPAGGTTTSTTVPTTSSTTTTTVPSTGGGPQPTTTISFENLGLGPTLTFNGPGASQSVTIPLPLKLSPVSMTGTLLLPTNLGSGYLNVTSGGNELGTVVVPEATAQQVAVPFSIPLYGAVESQGTASIQLTYIQTSSPRICSSALSFTLEHLAIGFQGELTPPTAISSFFPSVLHSAVLYVPRVITPAIEQTVLNIDASLVRRYNPMPFTVVLRTWDPTRQRLPEVTFSPFQRVLVINQNGVSGLNLVTSSGGAPILVISGTSASLPLQTIDLGGVPNQISQGTQAVVVSTSTVPELDNQELTFSQLGISSSFTGAGAQQLYLGVDQSLFGGNASSYDVYLKMAYSPVVNGDRGTVVAQVGGVILGSTVLNSSGSSTLDFTVPSQLITRVTGIQLQVSFYPVGGVCTAGYRTMSFDVDPRSTVTATPMSGGTGGFVAVPAAMTPTFQVALDQPSLTRLQVATSLVGGLQQLTNQLLVPQVTSLSTAQGDQAPLLVVGTAHRLRSFDAPLQGLGGTLVVVNAATGVTLNPEIPLASIQVFSQSSNQRTVVMAATSGRWSLFGPIFRYLGATNAKWQALTGDVLATSSSGQVVNVAIRAGLPSSDQFTVPPVNKIITIGLLASVIAIVVVLGIGFFLVRRRRKS